MLQESSEFCKKQVFDQWARLEHLAKKRFPGDAAIAEEAVKYVLERLEADDWRRVRAYNGTAKFTTYLTSITLHLLEDFYHHKFGKVTPPEWLKNMGALWLEVFKRLCRECRSPTEVVNSMTVGYATGRDPAYIQEAIEVILKRVPDCGCKRGETVSLQEHEINHPGHAPTDETGSPEDCVMGLERSQIIGAVCSCLFAESTAAAEPDSASLKFKKALELYRSRLKLTAEDRIFLKMIFQDGCTVVEAGESLGWNNNQAQGKHRRLREHIAAAFEACGLAEEIKHLVR